MTSCPGTRGYWIPGQSPSLTNESLWQTPHASTLTRTHSRSASGMSRSTNSSGPPARGTWTTRIFLLMRFNRPSLEKHKSCAAGSGERTRLACWRARPCDRELCYNAFPRGELSLRKNGFAGRVPTIPGSRQTAETYTLAASAPRNTNTPRVLSTIHANGTGEAIPKTMRDRRVARVFLYAGVAAVSIITVITAAATEDAILTGKAAMGDWMSDAPGIMRRITVQDLPPPSSNALAINRARVVDRPANAQPKVPPGFKIELYASGFRDPRFLLSAPNGDIFVVESRANQIKVLRDSDGDDKPDITELFTAKGLNKPFGIAFYPPGDDPQFLYVANTDGVIRFPYRNGDLKARGPAQHLSAHLSPGALLRGGGHWTRCIVFSPDGKKMYVSIGSRSNVSDKAAEE